LYRYRKKKPLHVRWFSTTHKPRARKMTRNDVRDILTTVIRTAQENFVLTEEGDINDCVDKFMKGLQSIPHIWSWLLERDLKAIQRVVIEGCANDEDIVRFGRYMRVAYNQRQQERMHLMFLRSIGQRRAPRIQRMSIFFTEFRREK
jgi:hypothetical protein